MKIIGFNIEEISGKRNHELKRYTINTDITFNNVEKSKLDVLKESEALKLSFKFQVNYKDAESKSEELKSEISILGSVLLMVDKELTKEFLKSWKNKELPKDKMVSLYNFILKKCSVRALQLEEDLNLQPHIPFPQIKGKN
ncbi:hypothetical protein FJZ21_03250 [Candidatus Pacearchaeota archaeon]|nr:hypothetical protein [Candidatus Pacearchaeota archaeon]